MAVIGLLFKQRVRIGKDANLEPIPSGAIEMDASLSESHTSTNEVTRFPVESGIDITDHVRRQPERITIRGIVTDTPLIWGGGENRKRSGEAYEKVIDMINKAELINVVTTLREYENMVIESLEVPRNAQLGNAVELNLTLTEVRTVEVLRDENTIDKGTQVGIPIPGGLLA